jgi:hypothetical protein
MRALLAVFVLAGCADKPQPAVTAAPPPPQAALVTGCMVPALYELSFAPDAMWDCGPGAPAPVQLRLGLGDRGATLVDPSDADASVEPYAIGCYLSVKYASYRYGFNTRLTFANGGFTGTIDQMSWTRADGTRCTANAVAVTARVRQST